MAVVKVWSETVIVEMADPEESVTVVVYPGITVVNVVDEDGWLITIVIVVSDDTTEMVVSVIVEEGVETRVVVEVIGGGRQRAPTGSP